MSEEGGAGAVGPTQIDNKPKDDKIEKPQAVMEKESSAENSAPTQKTAVPAAAPEEVSTARSELSLRSPTLSTIVAGSPGDAASPALNTAIASTPNPPSMRRSIRRSVRRSTSSKSRRQRATLLTFHEIVGKETLARVQLVLCNISDRTLRFKLKSNPESKLTALPSASAHIAPHSQVRVVLSWSRENEEISWREAAQPKILLVTKFLDDNEITGLQEQATSTRLVARVSTSRKCDALLPPTEQLLLDAVGKNDTPHVEKGELLRHELMHDRTLSKEVEMSQGIERLIILIMILIILLLLLTRSEHRDDRRDRR